MVTKTEEKRDFFGRIAAQWDSLGSPPDAARKQRKFVRLATAHRPTRILDVGCGTGVLVPHLQEMHPRAQITELDFSQPMLDVNRGKHDANNVEFCCNDLLHAPFAPDTFDSILFFNVLPHIESHRTGLAKAFELLNRGGRLAVGHLMGSRELNAFHATLDGPVCHDRLPSSQQLAGLLTEVGFRSVRVEERPDWYFVLAEKGKR